MVYFMHTFKFVPGKKQQIVERILTDQLCSPEVLEVLSSQLIHLLTKRGVATPLADCIPIPPIETTGFLTSFEEVVIIQYIVCLLAQIASLASGHKQYNGSTPQTFALLIVDGLTCILTDPEGATLFQHAWRERWGRSWWRLSRVWSPSWPSCAACQVSSNDNNDDDDVCIHVWMIAYHLGAWYLPFLAPAYIYYVLSPCVHLLCYILC